MECRWTSTRHPSPPRARSIRHVEPVKTRLHAEALGDRITPSAFNGLNVAVSQFIPVDPCLTASPVFVGLGGGGSVDTPPA
jgi:hypothetical protein